MRFKEAIVFGEQEDVAKGWKMKPARAAIVDGDGGNPMARLGRHNSSLRGTRFIEGEMARKIRAYA